MRIEVIIELRYLPSDHFSIIALKLIEQVMKIEMNAFMNNSVLRLFIIYNIVNEDGWSGDMELFLNGSSLGVRLSAPYEWLLPPEVHGETVEVRLAYSVSIAGLFGHPHPGDDEFSAVLRRLFAPEYRHAPDFFEVDFI